MRDLSLVLYSLTFKVPGVGFYAEMCHLVSDVVGRDGLCCRQIESMESVWSKSTSWVSLGSTCTEPCKCNLLHPANTSSQMGFYPVPSRGLLFLL